MTTELKQGTIIQGFKVNRIRDNKGAGGKLAEMTHLKTGAELCWLDNGEENKLFSVAFKTTPENSTGVFHILEHSVLCGSDKFRVREPFVELLKSSMNTFLNAMTYPDKTLYPVSSRNKKDFLNLTQVYLDAVFKPLLTEKSEIFHQEGWHYELDGNKKAYNGVVFNEMKGATAGVDERIEYALLDLMFPDNCYHFNSGGDPAAIPDLTYEMFVDTYNRYYHPSNSRFYLDGDIPLEETLTLINSYLDEYEKKDINPEIPVQQPVSRCGKIFYEVEQPKENGDALAFGKILCTYDDAVKIEATKVLCDALASSNQSPLKKALLENQLCEDMELFVNTDMLQPFVMLVVRNTTEDKLENIKETVENVIKDFIKKGIDKEELVASLNMREYRTKQLPEPQAIYRASNCLASWLYGGDPMLYLDMDSVYQNVRKMLDSDEFENILKSIFLDDSGWTTVIAKPSVDIGNREVREESERLEKEISSMTEEQLKKIKSDNEKLELWQQTPDSKEDLETLPTLELKEVEPTPEKIDTRETVVDGVKVLHHNVQSNGVVHFSMYFPISHLTVEELSVAQLIPSLLGELPTENYTAAELQRKIKTYIGQIDFSINVFAENSDKNACTPYLVAKVSTLCENLEQSQILVAEILNKTKFNDKSKVEEIVKQIAEEGKRNSVSMGHILGMLCVKSRYSALGAANEAVMGYSALKTNCDIASNFDNGYSRLLQVIEKVMDYVGKIGAVISYTCDTFVNPSDLISLLREGKACELKACYKSKMPKRAGIKIPSQVSYAVKGYDIEKCREKYDGSFAVAAKILTLSYLWNKVRVQGGAYGTGFSADKNGGVIMYSYRDPSPSSSLKTYDQAADYLAEFVDDDTENLDNYIISTIAAGEPLLTPKEKGSLGDNCYFTGWTYEKRVENRQQMLSTTGDKLKKWCSVINSIAQDGSVCVVGNEDAVNNCGEDMEIFEL